MQGFNVPFYTRKEALRQPLAEEEMRLLDLARWIRNICWMIMLGAPLALLGYAFYAMSQPHWKVNVSQLRDLEKQIQMHNIKRDVYAHTIDRINKRVRPDLIAKPILSPAPKKLFLDSVDFQTKFNIMEGELVIQGHTTKLDKDIAAKYVDSLQSSLRNALPDFQVSLSLTDSSMDAKSGYLKFTITGKIQ